MCDKTSGMRFSASVHYCSIMSYSVRWIVHLWRELGANIAIVEMLGIMSCHEQGMLRIVVKISEEHEKITGT